MWDIHEVVIVDGGIATIGEPLAAWTATAGATAFGICGSEGQQSVA